MCPVSGRSGFSLVELVVAMAVIGVVAGAVHSGLTRQQRAFRAIAAMVAMRADVRDAAAVLESDLRPMSPLDTIPLAADSAIEFYGVLGSSVSCDSAPGYTVRIPPERLASGAVLTALLASPDSGDQLLLYSDDSAHVAGEPRWERHAIASVSTQAASLACPPSTGFTAAGDASEPAYIIALRREASAGVRRGAPVRFVRRNRYSLYRSASRWYLGNRRCNAVGPSVCGVIQPLSGPYAPYSASGVSGIGLRYFDSDRAPLAPAVARVRAARLDISVRSAAAMIARPGLATALQYEDSARISLALRNRD